MMSRRRSSWTQGRWRSSESTVTWASIWHRADTELREDSEPSPSCRSCWSWIPLIPSGLSVFPCSLGTERGKLTELTPGTKPSDLLLVSRFHVSRLAVDCLSLLPSVKQATRSSSLTLVSHCMYVELCSTMKCEIVIRK